MYNIMMSKEHEEFLYGSKAVRVRSDLAKGHSAEKDKFIKAEYQYVIGHPELLTDPKICEIFRSDAWNSRVSHIVIDEAHSVIQWGQDFRPDFLKLPKLRSLFPDARVVALTATATKTSQEEIAKLLVMRDTRFVMASMDRTNIKIVVLERPPRRDAEAAFNFVIEPLANELEKHGEKFPRTIVYSKLKECGSGYEAATVHSNFADLVSQYHAACTDEMKKKIVNAMAGHSDEDGSCVLLFATEAYSMGTDSPDVRRIVHIGVPTTMEKAYSMGTDSPDVRRIVHVGVPTTMETYIQEVGRGGRDGLPCKAIMYFNRSDIASNVKGMTDDMRGLCTTNECRRKYLCEHFGCEHFLMEIKHNCCDVCEKDCTCSDCALWSDTGEIMPSAAPPSPLLIDLLQQYFQGENSISGEFFTHLTTGLAQNIAKLCANAEEVNYTVLKDKYPYIRDIYLGNILVIVDKFANL